MPQFERGDAEGGIGVNRVAAPAGVGIQPRRDVHRYHAGGIGIDHFKKGEVKVVRLAVEACAKDGIDHQIAVGDDLFQQGQVFQAGNLQNGDAEGAAKLQIGLGVRGEVAFPDPQDHHFAATLVEPAGNHGAVAAVVSAAAEDAGAALQPLGELRGDQVGAAFAGGFHQDPGGQAEFLGAAAVKVFHLGGTEQVLHGLPLAIGLDGQFDLKGGAFVGNAFDHANLPLMVFFDDAFGQAESQSPAAGLGGDAGIEDSFPL